MTFNPYWPGYVPMMDPSMENMFPYFLPYPYTSSQPHASNMNDAMLQESLVSSVHASTQTDGMGSPPQDTAIDSDVQKKLHTLEELLLEVRQE